MCTGHLEQVGRALALLPERRPLAWPAPGQQQGPGSVLPEVRCEERRRRELGADEIGNLLGIGKQVFGVERTVYVGQPQCEAVVRVHRLQLDAAALRQTRL